MPEVVLDSVSMRYDDVLALDSVDLAIHDGEFLVAIGPSGSGKTTLLRVIAGLDKPTGGHVSIAGRVVDRVPPHRRGLALLSQDMSLYPHLTARGNLEFPLKVRHTDAATVADRVEAVAAELGVAGVLDRRPAQLSAGQRQAVATGRAVVGAPAIVLLDEPFSQVDAQARLRLRTELRQLREVRQATVILATNDQEIAMSLADRLAVLRDGTLQQVGPPRAVYRRPVNTFVADFVGTMNLMRARVVGADPTVVQLGSRAITVADRPSLGARRGEVLVAGLRPEALHYGSAGLPGEHEHRLGGRVAGVEHLGREQIVHIDSDIPTAGGEGLVELAARVPGDVPVATGGHLALAFDPSRLHFFDAAGRAVG